MRLKKVVGKPHSNIYDFIEVIKKEEATMRTKIQMLESRAQMASRRRRVRDRERRFQELFHRLNS